MSDELKLLMDRLAELRPKVTDEPLHESGRYFNEGTFWDLTQCTHGDTGRFRNDADGKAIAILWELWRSGALVPAPAVPDDVAKIVAELRVIGCHENGDARCTCGIGMDAADALEAQAAELARYREALQPFASAWSIAQASGLTGMSQLGSLARNEVAAVAFMKAAALTQPTGDRT